MKKIIFYIISICIIVILFFSWYMFGKATLVTNQAGLKESGNFTLHIRVEEVEQGIKVYRSLQYMGKEKIEIEHQTPLISISLGHKNHDFTGSTVTEEMNYGNSYYPQKAKIIKISKKGEYTLYCLAEFRLNGKKIQIEHTEELLFE